MEQFHHSAVSLHSFLDQCLNNFRVSNRDAQQNPALRDFPNSRHFVVTSNPLTRCIENGRNLFHRCPRPGSLRLPMVVGCYQHDKVFKIKIECSAFKLSQAHAVFNELSE